MRPASAAKAGDASVKGIKRQESSRGGGDVHEALRLLPFPKEVFLAGEPTNKHHHGGDPNVMTF